MHLHLRVAIWEATYGAANEERNAMSRNPPANAVRADLHFANIRPLLKWGSRSFNNSRFGQVLGPSKIGGTEKLKLDDGAFVYTVAATPPTSIQPS